MLILGYYRKQFAHPLSEKWVKENGLRLKWSVSSYQKCMCLSPFVGNKSHSVCKFVWLRQQNPKVSTCFYWSFLSYHIINISTCMTRGTIIMLNTFCGAFWNSLFSFAGVYRYTATSGITCTFEFNLVCFIL